MTHNENEFQGFFADFYDMLHEGCGDAEQYVSMLGLCGNKILELGSGTGRIVIPLAKAGFQVTGIEFESDMISLMEKKDYPRDRLHVVQADARHFSLDERFDVILLSCNFLNQVENDTIRREEWKDGVLIREACTEERLTWYYPREIRSLVREAGLRVDWESSALCTKEDRPPISVDSENMIFCCKHT